MFSIETAFIDFSIMSGLLLASKVLRVKLKFLQNFYMPVALIAGLLGIALGKFGLNILPFSEQASSYSGYLFLFLFASLFMGKKDGDKRSFFTKVAGAGDSVCLNIGTFMAIYGIAAIVGILVLKQLFPDINDAFGVLAAAGFSGGHGTAAAMGSFFIKNGWSEGNDIANTFATIGLIISIFLGLALIKYATKKGYTQVIKDVAELPEDMKTGLVKRENRASLATETINPMSLDSLAWHFALLCFVSGMGILFNDYVMLRFIPDLFFPDYVFAMIFGVVLYAILEKIGFGDYVDKDTITRIGATSTDYLAAFGIAMINIDIVITYLVPLIMMSVILVIANLFFLFVVARKLYNTYWFERAMYTFGMCTGVTSIGVLLLRVVDPEYKTGALADVGVALLALSPFDLMVVTLTPTFFIQGYGLIWGIVISAISLILFVLCKFKFTVSGEKLKKKNLRPVE